MAKTAQEVYESLPAFVTFADIQAKGGPRATAMRRWLRDNVPAYLERRQRSTVLDKAADKDMIMTLLSRVGTGQVGGLRAPDAADNESLRDGLARLTGKAPSAASAGGSARAESPGEKAARLAAAKDTGS